MRDDERLDSLSPTSLLAVPDTIALGIEEKTRGSDDTRKKKGKAKQIVACNRDTGVVLAGLEPTTTSRPALYQLSYQGGSADPSLVPRPSWGVGGGGGREALRRPGNEAKLILVHVYM